MQYGTRMYFKHEIQRGEAKMTYTTTDEWLTAVEHSHVTPRQGSDRYLSIYIT